MNCCLLLTGGGNGNIKEGSLKVGRGASGQYFAKIKELGISVSLVNKLFSMFVIYVIYSSLLKIKYWNTLNC